MELPLPIFIRIPAPLQGALHSFAPATQGVALGLHPPALSAPEDIVRVPY
jgi:hypothetical protein